MTASGMDTTPNEPQDEVLEEHIDDMMDEGNPNHEEEDNQYSVTQAVILCYTHTLAVGRFWLSPFLSTASPNKGE